VRGGSVWLRLNTCVDHATVIRRVDRLEKAPLGHSCLPAQDRYLLTEAGQRVADSAEAMESTIVANQEQVGGSVARLTGTVRIGAPDGFWHAFLAPRLRPSPTAIPTSISTCGNRPAVQLSKRERYRH